MNDELFNSAHAALAFAYNFEAQPPPGVLARLAGTTTIGRGKGLVGLDGAGQAGMILAEVREVGPAAVYILAARYAPKTMPCACRAPCCCGERRTEIWDEAIAWITEQALGQLSGHVSNFRLRRGIVARFFGAKVNIGELAEYATVSRNTVTEHNAKIAAWLRKEEARVLHAIEGRLKSAGLV